MYAMTHVVGSENLVLDCYTKKSKLTMFIKTDHSKKSNNNYNLLRLIGNMSLVEIARVFDTICLNCL